LGREILAYTGQPRGLLNGSRRSNRGDRIVFDIYIGGWQATAQVLGIALLIGAVLWVMSKVEIKEREGKDNG